jgi:hypothetical protein
MNIVGPSLQWQTPKVGLERFVSQALFDEP